MAIVRKYGSAAVAGLAQLAGQAKSDIAAAEVTNQIALAKMQQQFEQAQTEAKLKSDFARTVLQQQAELQQDQQKVVEQQARDRMINDWEMQKMQLRSQNDFALEEKKHTLRQEYLISKDMQEQVETDNKIRQLDKDLELGRIDDTVKRASGFTEYEELYNQILYKGRMMRQSSEDALTNMIMQAINPSDAGSTSDAPVLDNTGGDASAIQSISPAVSGHLWWKKIHPEVIDPMLKKAAVSLPQLSKNDQAAIAVLIDSPNSQIVLAQKLKMYNKIMALMGTS
jgi:hypothetical protein